MWSDRPDSTARPESPEPLVARPYSPNGPAPDSYEVPLAPARRTGRRTSLVAVVGAIVAVLAGSALFVSGFTLGREQSASAGTPSSVEDQFAPFWEAYNKIRAEYVGEVDDKRLVEEAIRGLFEAIGDPYSGYMSSDEYKRSLASLSGQFEGIGAHMAARLAAQPDEACDRASDECQFVVVKTVGDSPAEKAGLQADDVILAVDGEPVDGKTLEETVARVRGPKGSEVTLRVLRAPSTEPFDLAIVRDVIKTEDVTSRVLADGEVAYLRIEGFTSTSAPDLKEQLTELVEGEGIDKVVLDLRDDPGGFVNEAQEIASQFVGSGPIFWEEYADGRKVAKEAITGGVATDDSVALVVLVNDGSASASEIVAGAIQDSGRGRLVGTQTFGKGTIQQWHVLTGDTGGFRLSVAKWLTPEQRWIHGEGLMPDLVVEQPEELAEGEDPQLDAAVELLLEESAAVRLPLAA
jgi:carboxyl-terminal processing protease